MLGLLTAVASLMELGLQGVTGFSSCDSWASLARGIQDLLCIGRQTPNHWISRQVLPPVERSSLVVQETTEMSRLLGGLARIIFTDLLVHNGQIIKSAHKFNYF